MPLWQCRLNMVGVVGTLYVVACACACKCVSVWRVPALLHVCAMNVLGQWTNQIACDALWLGRSFAELASKSQKTNLYRIYRYLYFSTYCQLQVCFHKILTITVCCMDFREMGMSLTTGKICMPEILGIWRSSDHVQAPPASGSPARILIMSKIPSVPSCKILSWA